MRLDFITVLLLIPTLLAGCAHNNSDFNNQTYNTEGLAVEIIPITPEDIPLLTQQHSQQTKIDSAVPAGDNIYRVGIGDVLSVNVWGHPDLTLPIKSDTTDVESKFTVGPDGTISFAYAAKLPVAGKTIEEVKITIENRLKRLVEEPQVEVKVLQFNSKKFYVTGETEKAGTYPITDSPLTLMELVSDLGELGVNKKWQSIVIKNGESSFLFQKKQFLTLSEHVKNRVLLNGDIVHFIPKPQISFFIYGDEVNTTKVTSDKPISLMEALFSAQDSSKFESSKSIFVIRKSIGLNKKSIIKMYKLKPKDLVMLTIADKFMLEDRDIIFISSKSSLAKFLHAFSSIFS